MATKKAKKADAKPAPEAKKKTLDELLKGTNPYEKAVAEYIRNRHDETLERAIVANQRSVQKCLAYVAGMARKKAKGAQCVVMSDEEVYGLAVHWFLDGDTPTGGERGAAVEPGACAPGTGPKKAEKPGKADEEQMFFGFWEAVKPAEDGK